MSGRCTPVSGGGVESRHAGKAVGRRAKAGLSRPNLIAESGVVTPPHAVAEGTATVGVATNPSESYCYRDPDKRRAYRHFRSPIFDACIGPVNLARLTANLLVTGRNQTVQFWELTRLVSRDEAICHWGSGPYPAMPAEPREFIALAFTCLGMAFRALRRVWYHRRVGNKP